MADIRLDRKVAVVTGATGGWGSGAAFALAARGAAVVLNSRTQAKLDVFTDRLNRQGGNAISVAQDIRTLEGASRLVERAVDAYGRVDTLVNCAGVTVTDAPAGDGNARVGTTKLYGGSLLDMTEESWNLVIGAELTAVFTCTKAAAAQMVAQGGGGSIITVVGTILGAAGQSSHAAAKGGVLNGIWSWSDELKPHGITVNGVRGYVRSLLTDPSFNTDDFDFGARRETAELPTEPAEAGELVAWLASAEASDITGAYLGIDGPRITMWEPKLPEAAVFCYPQWTAEELDRSLGPIVRRRPARPSMVAVVQDLFSAHDRARAEASRTEREPE